MYRQISLQLHSYHLQHVSPLLLQVKLCLGIFQITTVVSSTERTIASDIPVLSSSWSVVSTNGIVPSCSSDCAGGLPLPVYWSHPKPAQFLYTYAFLSFHDHNAHVRSNLVDSMYRNTIHQQSLRQSHLAFFWLQKP